MATSVKQKEITKVSKKGLEFIANEEGIVLKPYRDQVGIPTIGIGSTYYEGGKKVTMQDPPITKDRAFQLFANVIKTYEKGVWSVTRDDLSQNQFDALVSLCFNIGVYAFKGSTVLKRVNSCPFDPSIKDAFLMWRNAGKDDKGRPKPILLARRKREAALYFS